MKQKNTDESQTSAYKYFKKKFLSLIKGQKINKIIENSDSFSFNIGKAHNIRERESQQYSFGISDISNETLCEKKGVFGVVANDIGGLANEGELSTIAASTMLKYFNEKPFHSTPEIELLNMVCNANESVNRYLGKDGKGKIGSTVVSVIIKDKKLYWIAVGNSRICLVRDGALMQINREHTYGLDLDEKAAMGEKSYEEARIKTQRAALTNYLGMGKLKKIDRNVRPLDLLSGDRIILMSDGVFEALSDTEIMSVMNSPLYESSAMIEQMIISKSRPKQDNFTAVIFECV